MCENQPPLFAAMARFSSMLMPGALPAHRILKQTPDHACTLVLGHEGNIAPVKLDAAAVGVKAAGDGVKQR